MNAFLFVGKLAWLVFSLGFTAHCLFVWLAYTPSMRARILAANRANGQRYWFAKLYNLPFESAARTAAAVSANLAAMLFFFYISR